VIPMKPQIPYATRPRRQPHADLIPSLSIVVLLIISGIISPAGAAHARCTSCMVPVGAEGEAEGFDRAIGTYGSNDGSGQSPGTAPDCSVIDPFLQHNLREMNPSDRIEILVQFEDRITDADRMFMEKEGFETHHEMDALPLVHATGTRGAVYALSAYGRTDWMEFNAPMQYYMNHTADVIKARNVWEREIYYRNGDVGVPIDGSGVSVVVVDSGVDGGHPDLTYSYVDIATERPRAGQKLIYNVKSDLGEPTEFIQMENSDTSSGHGTHCAGTVAGTGAASAGSTKGVAPGAWLIGFSMGEGFATINELNALEWVYYNSRPGHNLANIRVVTNSWGPGSPLDDYDDNDATVRIIEKLTLENNVLVVFAAGNDGRDNQDGGTDTTNIFSKVPGAIGVAATLRDGNGMTDFSSRGKRGDIDTYPDIAAPGHQIWSAAAKNTMIGAAVVGMDYVEHRGEINPYYMAISGTSMATPHIAGVAALLWQACPFLHMSEMEEDYTGYPYTITDNLGREYGVGDTGIHEIEYILKATADYMPRDGNNYRIPVEHETGLEGHWFDYAQGYGLVNVDRAVAVALILNDLRDPDHDGDAEHPERSVGDALKKYRDSLVETRMRKSSTDTIGTSWEGTFTDADAELAQQAPFYEDYVPGSDQRHSVFVPAETVRMTVELTFTPSSLRVSEGTNLPEGSTSDLHFTIDTDGDGNREYPGDLDVIIPDMEVLTNPDEPYTKTYEVPLGENHFGQRLGREWLFDMVGLVLTPDINPIARKGASNDYEMRVTFVLDTAEKPRIEERGYRPETPSAQYDGGRVAVLDLYYDFRDDDHDDVNVLMAAAIAGGGMAVAAGVFIAIVLGYIDAGASGAALRKRFGGPGPGGKKDDGVVSASGMGTADAEMVEGPRQKK